jgi:hypothetical protein
VSRPPPPDDLFPHAAALQSDTIAAAVSGEPDAFDDALNHLYAHLAIRPEGYTTAERARVAAAGGYWAHAGGLNAPLMASRWTQAHTVVLDLGAGTGLQGLLLQLLAPHHMTLQVEISRHLIAVGRRLQRWLEIPDERVAWAVADVTDVRLAGVNLLYLYRPVRPDHPAGARFYRRIAAQVSGGAVATVVSVADPLAPLLVPEFETVYDDGQLTCLRRSQG